MNGEQYFLSKYLIPRLSFSKFMSAFCFFCPHLRLTSTVSMNRKVPSLLLTHLIDTGLGALSSANKNFHSRIFLAPV